MVGVGQKMRLEIRSLIEAAVAHGAFVRRFFHVQDLVNGQRSTLAESLAALDAFEWLLLRVNVSGRKKRNSRLFKTTEESSSCVGDRATSHALGMKPTTPRLLLRVKF